MHGDGVVVELFPKSEWRGKTTALTEGQGEEKTGEETQSQPMPTGGTPSLHLHVSILNWFTVCKENVIWSDWKYYQIIYILLFISLSEDIHNRASWLYYGTGSFDNMSTWYYSRGFQTFSCPGPPLWLTLSPTPPLVTSYCYRCARGCDMKIVKILLFLLIMEFSRCHTWQKNPKWWG